MSALPVSAATPIEFRPNAAAVIAARKALDEARAALVAPVVDGDPPGEDRAAKVRAAEAGLAAAEAHLVEEDPVFLLRVPTGRIRSLVSHAGQTDPDMPRLRSNAELLKAILAEADDVGLLDEDRAAVAEAEVFAGEGKSLPDELWKKVFAAAQDTVGGRKIIGDRMLASDLEARHRIRFGLVLPGRRPPLRDEDLDGIADRHLAAINAELIRLGTLSKDEAKNSAAP